jgi:arginyl-tRNA synthetase
MKINLNKVKLTPVSATTGSVCVFGAPDSEIQEWIFQNRLSTSVSDKFTNISLKDVGDVSQLFTLPPLFHAVDGFSPNLNKHLHLGHLSNFVFAKAFQSLGVGKHWFAVLGDTLTGEVSHGDAEKTYRHLCQDYGYQVNQIFHASKLQILNSAMLQDGTDEFTGCKVFRIGHDKQIVGVKSDGSTSYFYHDVAVAFELQCQRFTLLAWNR